MLDHNRSFPLDFQRSLHLSALPLLPEPTPPCSDSLKPTDPMSDVQIEATLTARAYQTEMYEKSIENNIIVVVCHTPSTRHFTPLQKQRLFLWEVNSNGLMMPDGYRKWEDVSVWTPKASSFYLKSTSKTRVVGD